MTLKRKITGFTIFSLFIGSLLISGILMALPLIGSSGVAGEMNLVALGTNDVDLYTLRLDGQVFYSSDGGTWSNSSSDLPYGYRFVSTAISGNHTYMLTSDGVIWRKLYNGTHWWDGHQSPLGIHPAGFAGWDQWKVDYGAPLGIPGPYPGGNNNDSHGYVAVSVSNNYIYVLYNDGTAWRMPITSFGQNNSANWKINTGNQLSMQFPSRGYVDIAVDDHDNSCYVLNNDGTVYNISAGVGPSSPWDLTPQLWTVFGQATISTSNAFVSLDVDPDNAFVYVLQNDGNVWRSGGLAWSKSFYSVMETPINQYLVSLSVLGQTPNRNYTNFVSIAVDFKNNCHILRNDGITFWGNPFEPFPNGPWPIVHWIPYWDYTVGQFIGGLNGLPSQPCTEPYGDLMSGQVKTNWSAAFVSIDTNNTEEAPSLLGLDMETSPDLYFSNEVGFNSSNATCILRNKGDVFRYDGDPKKLAVPPFYAVSDWGGLPPINPNPPHGLRGWIQDDETCYVQEDDVFPKGISDWVSNFETWVAQWACVPAYVSITGLNSTPTTSELYVLQMNGWIWKSTDGGTHWTNVFDLGPDTSWKSVAAAHRIELLYGIRNIADNLNPFGQVRGEINMANTTSNRVFFFAYSLLDDSSWVSIACDESAYIYTLRNDGVVEYSMDGMFNFISKGQMISDSCFVSIEANNASYGVQIMLNNRTIYDASSGGVVNWAKWSTTGADTSFVALTMNASHVFTLKSTGTIDTSPLSAPSWTIGLIPFGPDKYMVDDSR